VAEEPGRTDPPEATDGTDDDALPGVDRLLALTDGVVAIALTLLVLQLQIPASRVLTAHPKSAEDLWRALDPDAGELTAYLISFVVIAQYWLAHHRVLRDMRGHSEGLAWHNFAFLLALTLMPFTSDLLGRYGDNPVAVTLFSLNLAALSLTTQWIYFYAVHTGLLTDPSGAAHQKLQGIVRSVMVLVIVGVAVALVWTGRFTPFYWLLFAVVPFASGRMAGWIEEVRERSQPV
jgi:uncharacterized membrane protein